MRERVRSFPRRFRDTTDGDPTRAKLVGAPGLVAQTHPSTPWCVPIHKRLPRNVSASATHTTHADRCAVRLRTLAWACRHKHRVPCQHADSCRLAAQVLPPVSEKKFTEGHPKLKICVTGAGGFIASHLSKRLKEEGHFVRAVDWKENEYMAQETFCDEFINLDLRWPENCKKAVEGCDWCFNLAVRRHPSPHHLAHPRAASRCGGHRLTWGGWLDEAGG